MRLSLTCAECGANIMLKDYPCEEGLDVRGLGDRLVRCDECGGLLASVHRAATGYAQIAVDIADAHGVQLIL